MSELRKGRIVVSADLPLDFALREPLLGEAKQLVLLLHGYGEWGARILTQLGDALPEDAIALAPNGPFPFPKNEGERSKLGYAWYFYDFRNDRYIIDMETALGFLSGGIDKLGYGSLPLRIIGFSQGGYLAPFLGERLKRTRQVILLHATYLHEELGPRLAFRADNVVGSLDSIVDPENSRRSHAEVSKRARGGEFIRIEGAVHRIDEAAVRKTAELLQRMEA